MLYDLPQLTVTVDLHFSGATFDNSSLYSEEIITQERILVWELHSIRYDQMSSISEWNKKGCWPASCSLELLQICGVYRAWDTIIFLSLVCAPYSLLWMIIIASPYISSSILWRQFITTVILPWQNTWKITWLFSFCCCSDPLPFPTGNRNLN